MKKIDFSKVKVQMTFEGEPVEVDMRRELGNLIHQRTADLGLDEVARKIYFSEGEVEIPDEYIKPICTIVRSGFLIPAQEAICELLN